MSAAKPGCTYRLIDGRIKEFTLTDVSRRAVDDMFDIADMMLQEAILNNNLPFLSLPTLIDSGIGTQPFNPALTRLRAMMEKFPEARKGYVAIILPPSPLFSTLGFMMRPLAPMRIYTPSQREQALTWLLQMSQSSLMA